LGMIGSSESRRRWLNQLLHTHDTPTRTAAAYAVGVFFGFSPFLGLHTILATFIAFVFRFNKVAIYTGTFVNNPPLTLVPIIVASYAVGAFFMGRPLRIPPEGVELLKNPHLLTGEYYRRLFVQSLSIVVPFALGGMVLSVVCSLIAYPLTLRALRAVRDRKAIKS